jgi:hypothetical protein
MKIKSQRDFWSGLMFLVVGVAFAWGSTEYSFGSSARPGPGYFPFGLGVLLALLGGIVLFKALTLESEGGDPIGAVAWRPLIVLVVAVAIFGAALPRLGLVISLGILVAVSLLADREGSSVGASAIGSVIGVALAAVLLLFVVPVCLSALTAVLGGIGEQGSRVRGLTGMVVALAGRLVPFALVVWLLMTRTPAVARKTMEVVLLVATLICISCWMFIDGLGLTMPVWPAAFAN